MKPEALKHAMYFGLMLGLVFALNFFLSTLNNGWFTALQWVVTLAIPYLVYRLTVDCRDRVSGGAISYGAALWYGTQLFFYAALISAVFKFIYFKFLNPEYLPNMINESLKILDELNMLSGELTEEQVRQLLTPLYVTMQYIWMDVIMGVLVSLVTAAFAKKDKSIFDTDIPQTNNQ